MSLAQTLSTWATLNLLVVLAWLMLTVGTLVLRKAGQSLSARSELRLHYLSMSLVLALTFIHPFLPKNEFFKPVSRVWSAQSLKSFSSDYQISDQGGYLSVPQLGTTRAVSANEISWMLILIAVVLLISIIMMIARDLKNLRSIRRNSFAVRKIGNTSIFINESIAVPFSYWTPGHARVILPAVLLQKRIDYRIALVHELQHHRQKDTRWVYALCTLRTLCILNPAIHLWRKIILELQEFACDETLVNLKKVESQQYARCLFEVAESALHQKRVPVCATGLIFLSESKLLKRRIEKMFDTKKQNRDGFSFIMIALITLVMGVTSYASKSFVQDRRVSLEQAKEMLVQAGKTDFPLDINEAVLKELNRYVGTPEGREFMKKSLIRMKDFQPMIEAKLAAHGLPHELLAVPLVESGYQNLRQDSTPAHGAGIWMFIKSTANRYKLEVNSQVDQRMDPALLTEAAMNYLGTIHSDTRFLGDWRLALLSYNQGEHQIDLEMKKRHTQDAWVISNDSVEKDYLPRIIATILIMKNPKTVE